MHKQEKSFRGTETKKTEGRHAASLVAISTFIKKRNEYVQIFDRTMFSI